VQLFSRKQNKKDLLCIRYAQIFVRESMPFNGLWYTHTLLSSTQTILALYFVTAIYKIKPCPVQEQIMDYALFF